jgi:flagellar basal-body rod modification protein FlgD
MSSPISPLSYTQTNQSNSSSNSSNSSSNSSSAPGGMVANESTFLTLLVAQLKNQDPLSPTDSTQFVGELAQFSSLEQLTNINQNVGTIVTNTAPPATTPAASGTTSGSSSNQNTSSNGIS